MTNTLTNHAGLEAGLGDWVRPAGSCLQAAALAASAAPSFSANASDSRHWHCARRGCRGPVPRRWFNHQTLTSTTGKTFCTRNMIQQSQTHNGCSVHRRSRSTLEPPLRCAETNPIRSIRHSQWPQATCRNTGITTRMNALAAAAASWLRYVAECSELSLREVAGPSKGVEQHCVCNLWFARLAPGRAPALYMEPSAKVSSPWARRHM